MRVLWLADYGSRYVGSFIPMTLAARDAAARHGWGFETIFTELAEGSGWIETLRAESIPVRLAAARPRRRAGGALRAAVADRPVILHSHFTSWDVPAVIAALGRPQVGVIWHVHSPLNQHPVYQLRNRVLLGAVARRRVDHVLTVGPEIQEAVLARWSPPRRTTLFANGIELTKFAPGSDDERAACREALGGSPDRPLIAGLCWDWERKGGPLLLEAAAELRSRGQRVDMVLVSAGDQAGPAIASHGLDDTVRLVDGREDVRSLYLALDALVSASSAEGMPFAVLEALATGTEAVISDIPSHRFTASGLDACQIVPRTATAFAEAILDVIRRSPDDRRARVEQTRSRLAERVSLTAWSARLGDVYADVAAKHGMTINSR